MTTRALCAFAQNIFLRDLRAFVVKIVLWLRRSRAGTFVVEFISTSTNTSHDHDLRLQGRQRFLGEAFDLLLAFWIVRDHELQADVRDADSEKFS